MSHSPLRGFNRRSVDQLVDDEGVIMIYDYSLLKQSRYLGLWHIDYNLIRIKPELERAVEDQTITHEMLHPYEDLILEQEFSEDQIDWWARFHIQRDPGLPDHIRNHYRAFGFKPRK